MLRVFKITSPMSVGSWILAANGTLIAPAGLAALTRRVPRIFGAAAPLAALAGPGLSTYTAVLVANSAIPVWSEARRTLPFLFAAGSAASAGAAATMLTPAAAAGPAPPGDRRQHRRADRCGDDGAEAGRCGRAVRERHPGPAREGREGNDRRRRRDDGDRPTAPRRGPDRRRMLLAGAACERWAVFKAGFASAGDPAYTVGPQRDRLER